MTSNSHNHDAVGPKKRKRLLQDAHHKCQFCGRGDRSRDGSGRLEIHHIDRDCDTVDEHAKANLAVLCHHCHTWMHQRPEREDSPFELTDADMEELVPKDIEILHILAEEGPLMTGEIKDALTTDPAVGTVRTRLWTLMGLHTQVADRKRQLVVQDASNGKWGLPDQISRRRHGRVPDDPLMVIQRVGDERVRQAIERGIDRETVAEVMDVAVSTTRQKEKRAQAFGFPLDLVEGIGGGNLSSDRASKSDGDG